MKIIATILLIFLFNMCYGQQDTVKVIMLYSDTAITELVGVDEFGEEYTVNGLDEYTYWRKGFIVTKQTYSSPLGMYVESNVYFLDADKKPIPKTNVVWQYKEIR